MVREHFRILLPVEYGWLRGGMTRSVLLIAAGLRNRGNHVAVVLPRSGEAHSAFSGGGVKVFSGRLPDWRVDKRRPWQAVPRLVDLGCALVSAVAHFRPDVIVTNNVLFELMCAVVLRAKNIPRLHVQRCNGFSPRAELALRWALRSAERVVILTESQRPVTEGRLRVPSTKIDVIGNPTDLHLAPPSGREMRRDWGISDDQILVGVVGFPSENKHQETLLEAAAISRRVIREMRFAVVGGASCASDKLYLNRLVHLSHVLRVDDVLVFSEYVENTKAIMDALDVVVVTSRSEGFGRTIIEGWACEKPVVASRCGGPESLIIPGVNGLLYNTGDAEALAAHLVALARDPFSRRSMGVQGKLSTESDFSPERIAGLHERSIRAALRQ